MNEREVRVRAALDGLRKYFLDEFELELCPVLVACVADRLIQARKEKEVGSRLSHLSLQELQLLVGKLVAEEQDRLAPAAKPLAPKLALVVPAPVGESHVVIEEPHVATSEAASAPQNSADPAPRKPGKKPARTKK